MYNYFMLIGYICKDCELKEVGDGKRVVSIRLAIKREFQNMNGEYDTDFLNVSIWDFLAENFVDSLKKGAKIGLKGRITPVKKTAGDLTYYTYELNADRIVFLEEAQQDKKN